jgi:DNA-binding protein H-NS
MTPDEVTDSGELLEQKAALDRQIAEAQRTSRSKAIADVRALMAEHGLTAADLVASAPVARKVGPKAGGKVAAKYRHPESGATWTGRGLKPKWLTEALATGKSISDFAL